MDDERFPADFVNKLLDSDNRIGVWREYRGLTMSALAEAAGFSQSYLSDIENGKKDGSVKVLKRIAQALNTDVDLIV
jgi:DNA-binding helix-turn-helix protein